VVLARGRGASIAATTVGSSPRTRALLGTAPGRVAGYGGLPRSDCRRYSCRSTEPLNLR
jgi:hypothetical protein